MKRSAKKRLAKSTPMEEDTLVMKFRELFHTSRNFLLFPLILAGVVAGFALAYELMGAASFRHPWTWILSIISFVVFSAIIWFFYGNTSMENAKYLNGHKVFSGVDLGLHLPLNPERVNINRMARDCYGYGRWDAPYWFIGLGQSIGSNETVKDRAKVWSELAQDGLCDCRSFHLHPLIHDQRWHVDRVELQPTWRPLILLLRTLFGEKADKESLREYQRDHWGMQNDQTCIIELFGLPAKNPGELALLMGDLVTQEQADKILDNRIQSIREKIVEKQPKLVVMYGYTAEEQWKKLAGQLVLRDKVFNIGSTMMLWTKHPTTPNPEGDPYWVRMGNDCAKLINRWPPDC